jgi:hypothetical protein
MANTNEREAYVSPMIEDLGRVAELTRNGFSQGNDVGGGKSGGVS